jgi:hypothetical protein
MINVIKIVSAIVVIIGMVVAFFEYVYEPHGLLLESSPKRPWWLPGWLGLVVTSVSALLYITVDVFAYFVSRKHRSD